MGRSVLDTVLSHPDSPGIVIGGHLPIGLLAPIRYQPHPGPDREQAFVFAGEDDARLLAWRTQNRSDDEGTQTRFVVRPLAPGQWRDLLDRTISVRTVLAEDGPAVRFSVDRHAHGAATMLIEPCRVRDEVAEDDLPEERLEDGAGKTKPNRAAWLSLHRGSVRSEDDPEHAEDLEHLQTLLPFGPAATATRADGTEVEAYGYFTVTTTPDGTREVRAFKRQLDAEVVVERATMD